MELDIWCYWSNWFSGAIPMLKPLLKSYFLSILSAGEHLRICPQGYTCCTSAMEETLSNLSRREFEGLVREAGRSIQASLNAQYRTFDSEFTTQMHAVGRVSMYCILQLLTCLLSFSTVWAAMLTKWFSNNPNVQVVISPPRVQNWGRTE